MTIKLHLLSLAGALAASVLCLSPALAGGMQQPGAMSRTIA